MKTRSIARGFVGALSLAGVMGLVACGAEVGDGAAGDSAEIGSTSQAIVTSDVTAGTALPITVRDAASCIIDDGSGNKYLVVAGGETASNTFSSNAYLLDGSTWRGPFAFPSNLSSGSTKGAMMAIPGSPSSCLYVGGEIASAAKQSGIIKLTFGTVNSHPGVTIANAGTLITARSRMRLAQCGSESIAILGGNTAEGSIEVWHGQTTTTAINLLKKNDESTQVSLTDPRTDFAAANADSTHFAVGGGQDGSGKLGTVEAFNVQDDISTTPLGCKLNDNNNANAHYKLTPTITARSSLGVYYDSGISKFVFVGGTTGSASKKVSTVLVDFTTPASSALSAQADDLATATTGPVVIKVPSGNAFALAGSVKDYQENDATPWSNAVKYSGNTVDLVVRNGATGQFLPGGSIYVVGGHDGTNYLSSVDLITP